MFDCYTQVESACGVNDKGGRGENASSCQRGIKAKTKKNTRESSN